MRRTRIIGSIVALLIVAAALGALAAYLVTARAASAVTTLMVGRHPTLIAVDDRTGRAYLLDNVAPDASGAGVAIGAIHTLDTRSLTLVRTMPAGLGPTDIAVDQRTGRVFVLNFFLQPGGQGAVTVFDAQSGQVVRTTQVGDLPMALALDAGAGRVFVLNVANGVHGFHDHYELVTVLDAASGRLIGGINPAPGDGAQAGAGGLALDALRHRLVLTVSVPQNAPSSSGASTPLSIEAFDTRTDAPVWRVPEGVNQGVSEVCIPATGRTFVFLDHRVVVLDTQTGRLLRTIGHPIYGSPLVDARTRRLFLIEGDMSSAPNAPNWGRTATGHLTILDASSGALLRTVPIAWPDGAAIDERTGMLLIGHDGTKLGDTEYVGRGTVDLRDGTTGRLLSTVAVGTAPGAIAVDERHRRAIVVNQGGQVPQRDAWGWLPDWLRRRVPAVPAPSAPTRTIPGSVSFIDLP